MDWTKEIETGVGQIDNSKGTLVFVIDRFFHPGVICGEKTQTCGRLSDTLKLLSRNLEREEELMRACGYPNLQAHAGDHTAILQELTQMRQSLTCSTYDNVAVHRYLVEWTIRHTNDHDKPFADFWVTQNE